MEGIILNKPLIFNGDNYVLWKMRMKTFIMAHDYRVWMVNVNRPIIPMKEEGDVKMPKRYEELNGEDCKLIQYNELAKHYLFKLHVYK